jgi:hypothetical protein
LEGIHDPQRVWGATSRQIFGIEHEHAVIQARRDNRSVPEGPTILEVKALGYVQDISRRQDQWEQVQKIGKPLPSLIRGEALNGQLAGSRDKLAGDLPQNDSVYRRGNEV